MKWVRHVVRIREVLYMYIFFVEESEWGPGMNGVNYNDLNDDV